MAWLQYSDVMWERPEVVSRRGEHRADVRVTSALASRHPRQIAQGINVCQQASTMHIAPPLRTYRLLRVISEALVVKKVQKSTYATDADAREGSLGEYSEQGRRRAALRRMAGLPSGHPCAPVLPPV